MIRQKIIKKSKSKNF